MTIFEKTLQIFLSLTQSPWKEIKGNFGGEMNSVKGTTFQNGRCWYGELYPLYKSLL